MSRSFTSPLLLSLVFCLARVGACAEPAEPPSGNVEEQSGWKQWLSKGMDPAWWKAQWSKGTDLAKAGVAAAEKLDPEQLKATVTQFSEAIEKGDSSKIKDAAKGLEEVLSPEKLAEGFHFLIIQRQKGGEAAIKAVDEYAARKDLNELERAAAENLKKGMALLQRDDVKSYMVLAVIYACDSKLGEPYGMGVAVPIINLLLPGYLEEQNHPAVKP